jgi:hypothetical protein
MSRNKKLRSQQASSRRLAGDSVARGRPQKKGNERKEGEGQAISLCYRPETDDEQVSIPPYMRKNNQLARHVSTRSLDVHQA